MSKPSEEQIKKRKIASERHKARHFAMQALYQSQLNSLSPNQIEAQFRVDFDMKGTDLVYFRELIRGVEANIDKIDAELSPLANERELQECDPVTRALLRIGIYEMLNRIDVPYKVVINEAVNLAKKFGPEESHKFVNGLLDNAARKLRIMEVRAQNSR